MYYLTLFSPFIGKPFNMFYVSFDLEETVASPTLAVMRISNRSADPGNANAASAKGPFTGVLTDFMPIKVRDGDSQRVMFYGIVYSVKEVYDNSYGMVIEVQCRDYLTELRDNTTDGAYGYKIDTSVATSSSLTNATARDDDKKTLGCRRFFSWWLDKIFN